MRLGSLLHDLPRSWYGAGSMLDSASTEARPQQKKRSKNDVGDQLPFVEELYTLRSSMSKSESMLCSINEPSSESKVMMAGLGSGSRTIRTVSHSDSVTMLRLR